jgi:hypothetical protein
MEDATQILTDISTKLDELANQAVNMVSDDRSFMEIWGWNCPAMNRHDFAKMLRKPMVLIAEMTSKDVSEEDFNRLQFIPPQLAYYQGNTLPNLPGGNAFHVYLTTESLISNLEDILSKYVKYDPNWEEIKDKKLVPSAVITRLRNLETTISGMMSSTANLTEKMDAINSAHSAAEALPADQEQLRQARVDVEDLLKIAQTDAGATKNLRDEASNILGAMKDVENQSNEILKNAGVAYQASTAVGLGKEFDTRAKALAKEVKFLGVGLTVTLIIIAVISFFRADSIHELLMSKNFQPEKIWMEIGVSIGSLLAPVWLAWMLTKQIGQRFRLAEDYGFKASVAKAFAGYKAEAAHLDESFAKRLFESALDRIEEAPLRYVETENHGGPLQDFIAFLLNLKGIRKNLEQVSKGDLTVIPETHDKT